MQAQPATFATSVKLSMTASVQQKQLLYREFAKPIGKVQQKQYTCSSSLFELTTPALFKHSCLIAKF
jgi:hypothetical protein